MKKLLVSDYDQTFYLDDFDIEKNKKAVTKFKSKKNIFVIATGRSYYDFYNKQKKYNFNFDYAILNHGTTIINKNGKVLTNISINNDIIEDIKENLCLEESINSFCCSEVESRVDFNQPDLTKINIKYKSKNFAMEIAEKINNLFGEYVNAYYVSHDSVEIISNKTNKSDSIKEIMKLEDIDKGNVYTIGDGYSDIKMIEDYHGYAMKKSVQELKDVAEKEYDSVSKLIEDIME